MNSPSTPGRTACCAVIAGLSALAKTEMSISAGAGFLIMLTCSQSLYWLNYRSINWTFCRLTFSWALVLYIMRLTVIIHVFMYECHWYISCIEFFSGVEFKGTWLLINTINPRTYTIFQLSFLNQKINKLIFNNCIVSSWTVNCYVLTTSTYIKLYLKVPACKCGYDLSERYFLLNIWPPINITFSLHVFIYFLHEQLVGNIPTIFIYVDTSNLFFISSYRHPYHLCIGN